ncbi:hypothetical protein ACFVT2_19200 [Streptomyces sp. NPDC058000]|uniref:hypothetical protein n=1 Tax=Streptomyces sp. NPDC058000 TaxID=3346299 RepID=UPI0036EC81AD
MSPPVQADSTTCGERTCRAEFTNNWGYTEFTVPAGVESITMYVWGAGAGGAGGSTGGGGGGGAGGGAGGNGGSSGGYAFGRVKVHPGQKLKVSVGTGGEAGTAARVSSHGGAGSEDEDGKAGQDAYRPGAGGIGGGSKITDIKSRRWLLAVDGSSAGHPGAGGHGGKGGCAGHTLPNCVEEPPYRYRGGDAGAPGGGGAAQPAGDGGACGTVGEGVTGACYDSRAGGQGQNGSQGTVGTRGGDGSIGLQGQPGGEAGEPGKGAAGGTGGQGGKPQYTDIAPPENVGLGGAGGTGGTGGDGGKGGRGGVGINRRPEGSGQAGHGGLFGTDGQPGGNGYVLIIWDKPAS